MYPNPFSSETSIEYELIETSLVRLAVLDILGGEVAVLLDGGIEPGRYRVSFDASSLASGLYVALLSTPSQSAYRVMRVLK